MPQLPFKFIRTLKHGIRPPRLRVMPRAYHQVVEYVVLWLGLSILYIDGTDPPALVAELRALDNAALEADVTQKIKIGGVEVKVVCDKLAREESWPAGRDRIVGVAHLASAVE